MVLVSSGPRRSSRRRVALGLGAVIVAAIVVTVLATSGSGSHKPAATTSAFGLLAGEAPTKIVLSSPSGTQGTVGLAEVVHRSDAAAVALVAKGLAPNAEHNAYAVWLYNSPNDAVRLGFVNPGVGKNGHLDTAASLPSNANHYGKIVITLETTANPMTPGQIVLEGPLRGA
jgi:Anti-sigma-K factor rskA